MDRREALSSVCFLLGGTIVGSAVFLETGCTSDPKQVSSLINQAQLNILDEIAETILPATHTPGAKAAGVGEFMRVMVNDCYTPADQQIFIEGILKLDDECKKMYGKTFIKCDNQERTSFLVQLDNTQKGYMESKKPDQPVHYFRMMKELTLLGFFTSEVGATKALRYVAVPGKYDGNLSYKKGDKAWAT